MIVSMVRAHLIRVVSSLYSFVGVFLDIFRESNGCLNGTMLLDVKLLVRKRDGRNGERREMEENEGMLWIACSVEDQFGWL